MKTLVAAIGLLITITAQAIPVQTIDFAQNNWELRLFLYVTDSGTGQPLAVDAIRINGVTVETERSEFIWGDFSPLWEGGHLPGNIGFVWGLNTFSVVESGVTYVGPTFTLTRPTGPYPAAPVPDTGSTALLLLLSIGVAHFVRSLSAQRDAAAPCNS
jgi:hypothetical protein